MNKKERIKQYLKEPIKVGDKVDYNGEGNGSRDKNHYTRGTVIEIVDNILSIAGYYKQPISRRIDEVRKDYSHIGFNPFEKEIKIDSFQTDISGILYNVGYNAERKEYEECKYSEIYCNYNPYVIINNEKLFYQRDLVWEGHQKVQLIQSVFNRIDVGRILIKTNPYGTYAMYDLIDGKQRLNAIIEYIEDKFDVNGVIYSELSDEAQRMFLGHRGIHLAKLDDKTTDKEVLEVFIKLNNTGTVMNKEHLNKLINEYKKI